MIVLEMEMPKNCGGCEIKDYGDEHCDVWCAIERRLISDDKDRRPEWCPLKECQ